jgi:hypothetical protein
MDSMEKNSNGNWHVSKKGETITVLGPNSAVVAELPKGNSDDELRITIAYLIVAAPKLFEMCCKIKSIFENNLIVTREGFKINCSDIEKSLLDAILRARGCAKSPDEP